MSQKDKITSPGARLAKARAEKGLTTKQVSQQLRLHLRFIEAMEKDDYDNAPGPAFIKGYLRAYAKVVGLAPESIISDFDKLDIAEPEVAVTPQVLAQAEKTQQQLVRPWFAISLAATAIAAAVFWWQGRELINDNFSAAGLWGVVESKTAANSVDAIGDNSDGDNKLQAASGDIKGALTADNNQAPTDPQLATTADKVTNNKVKTKIANSDAADSLNLSKPQNSPAKQPQAQADNPALEQQVPVFTASE